MNSKFISKHPLELLAFAAEHDHETLMYEVAPLLIAKPLSEIAYLLPSSLYIPWVSTYVFYFPENIRRRFVYDRVYIMTN